MVPKFLQKKFAGVQQPLGRWILRHVAEFIVLSPAILVTWLWLKFCRKEVIIVGQFANNISNFLSVIEPILRNRLRLKCDLSKIIFLNLSNDPNLEIRKMYDQVVQIVGVESKCRRRILWWAFKCGLSARQIDEQTLSDASWLQQQPSVSLSSKTYLDGFRLLESLQISVKQPILCYTLRTSSYYQKQRSLGYALKLQSLRNPIESNYIDVAKYFSNKNFRVFRMGKHMEPTRICSSSGIIDYSNNFRTDHLDVFLLNQCKFLLNGGTGIFWFRAIFNKESVHADVYDIRVNYFRRDLFSLQRVWLERENRFATFKEMLQMPGYSEEKHQERLGVRLVKNTVEEIKAVCDEMNARIDGTWVSTSEDEELQRRYQDLIVKYSNKPEWNGGGRIGAQFLRENQDLLRE